MRTVILGTDWFSDCDDALAVRLLVNFHRMRRIRLLGVCINACLPESAASLDAFLRYSGVVVPIALDRSATNFEGHGSYQHNLTNLPSKILTNDQAEEPVAFYRRLLAAAEEPVDIMEIGFPQVLSALLASSADEYSPLSGCELVRSKVRHLWIMAGKWDEDGGREHNFCNTRVASEAAAHLCRDWSAPITFLGFEVGVSVISARNIPADDPLHQVLIDHGSPDGRCSWDPMLIMLGVDGDPEHAGYRCVRGRAEVNAADGANRFYPDAGGPHRYVVKMYPDEFYADEIDRCLAVTNLFVRNKIQKGGAE